MSPLPADLLRDDLQLLLAFVVACMTALFVTPRLRAAALRLGIVDAPDGKLKTHREPVAYLGGLAVALGVLASMGLTYQFDHAGLAILLGSSIVLVLGLIDDLVRLDPLSKLAGQVLAAAVLVKAGVFIQLTYLPPWVAIPLTVLWIVAATNAFNLIDIMDGLSSGVGAVAAAFFAVLAFADGRLTTAFLGAALAGALIGFRRYNVHPAKIYLGDTGSLFSGFLLGALAVANSYTRIDPLGVLAPLLILGVPLFDMLFVIWIRWRRGMPVMLGSPDHVALRLRRWKLSVPATVRANVAASVVLGSAGVALTMVPPTWALGILGALLAAALGLALWLKSIDMSL
ncbi:MAG: undecaprenyl/decaprenyl-phosphate alpha-N-acetylglucosaminyl 1-phosphate transferase [Acidobacteria bacterium]|nr:undecaprenyl/decaprenyl-phosphate alpha-N-acetylglucosaminyl 1-phosphate transferase [Acidobacteriota bacterium]